MNHLVIGGSLNPARYSNMAIQRLREHKYSVKSIGLREGEVHGVKIDTGFPEYSEIHTITMYINPSRQPEYYNYLLGLKPSRIIFNPGTENAEFEKLANDKGIETIEACTLVMLSVGNY